MAKKTTKMMDVNSEVEKIDYATFCKVFRHFANPSYGEPKSIFLRGVHGVGKSSIVRHMAEQIAADLNRNFIEMSKVDPVSITFNGECPDGHRVSRGKHWWNPEEDYVFADIRIAQRDFVDFIGSVDQSGNEGDRVTRFAPVDWVRLFSHPDAAGCIFFDETDRGTVLVRQAVFEAVLDRRINGNSFARNVCLVSAGNSGVGLDHLYDSTPMDAALTSRFATYQLHPTVDEWISWARGTKDLGLELVADYITANQSDLDYPEDANADSDAVMQTRRGWGDVGRMISRLVPDLRRGEMSVLSTMSLIASSLVGRTMATKFSSWCQENRSLCLDDILNDKYTPGKREIRASEAINIFRDVLGRISVLTDKTGERSYKHNNNAVKVASFFEDVYEDNREIATTILAEITSALPNIARTSAEQYTCLFGTDVNGPLSHIAAASQRGNMHKRNAVQYAPRFSDYAKKMRKKSTDLDTMRKNKQQKSSEETVANESVEVSNG